MLIRPPSSHSCRYPTKPSDTAKKFDPATHNHVVFVRKNKFYKVALADKSGRELSAAELEAQIEKVIELAGNEKAAPVGALTSENRDIWTDVSIYLIMPGDSRTDCVQGSRCSACSIASECSYTRGDRVCYPSHRFG